MRKRSINIDELMEEFIAGFSVYVRTTDGTLNDTRDKTLRDLLKQPVDVVCELMQPADLAVLLSTCVGVNSQRAGRVLNQRLGAKLDALLTQLKADGQLPLIAQAGHPVSALLDGMLGSLTGRDMYQRITWLLHEVAQDPKLRAHVFRPAGAPPARTPEVAHDEEQAVESPTDTDEDEPRPLEFS